jgi:hypothetical protein
MAQTEQAHHALDRISKAGAQFFNSEQYLYDLVKVGREKHELTWAQIGLALGVSRSAACQRFSKPPRGRLV